MIDIEKALEFDKIKERMIEYAFTDNAKEKIKELVPIMAELELKAKLRETSEARLLLEKFGEPPLSPLSGISELLSMAAAGGCLIAEQLENIKDALTAVHRLKDYLKRCKQCQIGLPYYEENLEPLEDIRKEIEYTIRDNRVDDYASKLLHNLRVEISTSESSMREKADNTLRVNKQYMSDSFSTIRNGHVCVPVKAEYRFKVSGQVIGKSSTGSTLFIEPAAAAKIYEELQVLLLDEENEVRRILYQLTGVVADAAEVIKQDIAMIEKLDFIFTKGKLSISYDGIEPVMNTNRKIRIVSGRHPLMDKNICVPLQFEMGNGINGVIITGPNTGGKTVAIKTVALNSMMAQCGLHVACKEAELTMNSSYLCDIGDGQNLSENLSTFSAHIANVLDILSRVDKESLVIMDELGSGTDPTEGMGIAIAILEELKLSGALYLVTTHYPEVKNYAQREPGVVNARMTFDKETIKPLYQLVLGEAGESCAFYIASRLGMPERMLIKASEAAYGADLSGELKTAIKHLGGEGVNPVDKGSHHRGTGVQKLKTISDSQARARRFNRGDSVMVYPEKKIGIVCQTVNDQGKLQILLAEGKKMWINHKRIKLQVAASELYPEDYDFSVVFDSVHVRKTRHQMERKYVEGVTLEVE